MTKRMLIDATHAEETRVAVVDGHRLVDFDYESKVRKQLKGSIFLAKVTRVEPSLQAAFVNFGGNRHGFLPFAEIHPDYYRIPIADREAILAEQEREMKERLAAEEAEDSEEQDSENEESAESRSDEEARDEDDREEESAEDETGDETAEETEETEASEEPSAAETAVEEEKDNGGERHHRRGRGRGRGRDRGGRNNGGGRMAARAHGVEILGGDGIEGDQPYRPSMRRNYKIQEVIKRGQIMLVQVSKEERGNKGAAVSAYMSLPGRYCVLMPNSPRAGGVSRKIANFKERKRMREILHELQVPQGMSVIMRTAGMSRTKTEIKRDLDYLMKLWDGIRDLTLQSTAPAMVHEEGHLIRRAIRDIYGPDIEDIIVSGENGYKLARDFMKMMIPSHVKKVKEYKDPQIPLFHRYQVESQIVEIGDPVVTLPSGGYLVINPTEALVSVDVNSGRATKERHIEETALRTNMEAAEEVARQLRLRDLGGLIVIDFIDMEDRRNNRKVENKMKVALSTERARIQIGRISSFGLMELSRQRLNPSLTEAQFEKCSHCKGIGYVKSVDSSAINALRALEEEGIRNRSKNVILHVSNAVALYILNNKRPILAEIESRYGFSVAVSVNEDLAPSGFKIEPLKNVVEEAPDNDDDAAADTAAPPAPRSASSDETEQNSQSERRRRGRRGGRRRGGRFEKNEDGSQAHSENRPARDREHKPEAPASDEPMEAKESKPSPARRRDKEEFVSPAREEAPQPPASEAPVIERGGAEDGEKKKRPARRRKPAAAKNEGGETAAAPVPETASPRKAQPEAASPSNDTQPKIKEYEHVNEPPSQKKKGWWNKLTE